TVLMLTLILTVIGLAAITSTSLDIKMAGGGSVGHTSEIQSRFGIVCGVQLIQQTLANGAIPATLTGAGANPSITLPLGTAPGQNPLDRKSVGQGKGKQDSADPTVGKTSNAVLTISNYTGNIDIDRLYAKPKSGS